MRLIQTTLRIIFTLVIAVIAIRSLNYKHLSKLSRSHNLFRQTLFATKADTLVKGYAHTDESKAKISAGNKGKTPWNQGKKHSEETRQRIAEKTKQAALQKKLTMATELGMTLEEFDQHKKDQALIKQQLKKGLLITAPNGTIIPSPNATSLKGGLTEDGRKRISESIKARWQVDAYRQKYTLQKGRQVSQETRQRISEALKMKWQDDDYRLKCTALSISTEQREKISNTLKNKWNDPEFKSKMTANLSYHRSPEWRANVSQKIKDLWNDPVYRSKVIQGYKNTSRVYGGNPNNKKVIYVFKNGTNIDYDPASEYDAYPNSTHDGYFMNKRSNEIKIPAGTYKKQQIDSSSSPTHSHTNTNNNPIISAATRKMTEKDNHRMKVYAKAKQEVKNSISGRSRSIRSMIGDEYWMVEKVRKCIYISVVLLSN